MKQLERRKVLAGIGTTVGGSALAGCSSLGSLNPFASDEGESTESLPGPFRKVESKEYDLVVSFDPPKTERANQSASNSTQRPDVGDVTQVLLENSAGEVAGEEALGNRQIASFPLLTLAENGIEVESALDLGRYTILATGPNGEHERDVRLTPGLSVENITMPNQLEDAATPNSVLAYANPIIEFSNSGTAPGIIVESSFSGSDVPSEREASDNRDEEDNVTPGALAAQFDHAKQTDRGVLALSETPVPVASSTLIQTGFSPLAIPQERYAEGGEEGGGEEALRSKFTDEDISASCELLIREGSTFELDITISLSGGLSEVTGPDGTAYYVFRSPEVTEWDSSISSSS